MAPALSKSMTVSEFDHGYWYADELRDFAKSLGVPDAGRLRKDELEKSLREFLATGKLESPAKKRAQKPGRGDVERGLSLALTVVDYKNDWETKAFLELEAQKLAPGLKLRSGVRYRLNRWREEQLARGAKLTYGDVVREYVRLNQSSEPFAKIPHGRYINFVAEFLAKEPGATREAAVAAWAELKELDAPKEYRWWARFRETGAK